MKKAFNKTYHDKKESIKQKQLENPTPKIAYEKAKSQVDPKVQMVHKKSKKKFLCGLTIKSKN